MKLFSVDEASEFSIDKIHILYKEYVNKSRVDLLSVFGFGNEKIESAEGLYIYTSNGKKVYDFTGGFGVLSHGHNHPRILSARIKYEQERRMEVHKNYFSPYIAALCHNLAELLPGDLNYSFFPNSGAEAVDAAMRAAYKYHDMKRTHILFSNISFHGKLLGPSSVTLSPENDYPYPRIPNTHSFKFDDIESIKVYVKKLRSSLDESQIAAIICEPFSVSNMRHSSENFLRQLRNICDQENIVLIFDEVYTGWCKTGDYFYFMRYPDLVPDILCMAKSFGGGKASISGVVMVKKVYQAAFDNPSSNNLLMSTFYGFGEETVTAIEAVNIMVEDNYPIRSKIIEDYMTSSLENLTKKFPNQIKGWGGCGAIYGLFLNCGPDILSELIRQIPSELFKDKLFLKKLVTASVVSALYDKYNILTFTSFAENTHLILSPPLITSKHELDYLMESLEGIFEYGLIRCIADFVKRKFFR